MKNNTIFIIGAIVLSIILYFMLGKQCHLGIDKSATQITSLLVPYGILAVLIERFVNNFIIPEENKQLKTSIRTKQPAATITTLDHSHSRKFMQYCTLVGLVMAAFGFRFFGHIVSFDGCSNTRPLGIQFPYLFNILDIFLTSILLSGGSQLINRIVLSMTPKM